MFAFLKSVLVDIFGSVRVRYFIGGALATFCAVVLASFWRAYQAASEPLYLKRIACESKAIAAPDNPQAAEFAEALRMAVHAPPGEPLCFEAVSSL